MPEGDSLSVGGREKSKFDFSSFSMSSARKNIDPALASFLNASGRTLG
jgi:hypothetical protein